LIHARFLRSRATQDSTRPTIASPTGLSPSAAGLSRPFDSPLSYHVVVLLPRCRRNDTGLGCSPFARHYLGNHCCFLFLGLLRCFSSAGSPPLLALWGCPIRKSSDQRSCAAPRSLSQLYTSFVASLCQGIHRVLFLSFFSESAPHAPRRITLPSKPLLSFLLLRSHYVKEHPATIPKGPSPSKKTIIPSGARRSRTDDLLLARQAL
jgi:hypothetical protein